MSYDGIVTHAMVREWNQAFVGGRIQKIHQPTQALLRLDIFNERKTETLILSTAGNSPYGMISNTKPENPQTPPQFCMILRKHLQNGKITTIKQQGLDRIFQFNIQSYNELGEAVEFSLIVELTGKYSNIVLVDETGKIVGAQKRMSKDFFASRLIYPGLPYEPMVTEKKNLLDCTIAIDETEVGTKLQKWLLAEYEGFGPLFCREICLIAGIDANKPRSSLTEEERQQLEKTLKDFQVKLQQGEFTPTIAIENGKDKAYHAYTLNHLGLPTESMPTMNETVARFVGNHEQEGPARALESQLLQVLKTRIDRAESKRGKMMEEYHDSLDREHNRLYGDLLSAHGHAIHRGQKEAVVQNYFEEDAPDITIPLDEKKDARQNAAHYYKVYQKKKNRELILEERIPETDREIAFLKQALHDTKMAKTPAEFREVQSLLVQEGYLKQQGKKKKESLSKPMRFTSSDGFLIFVGKNHAQNDELTMRFANRDDLFFHAKDVPGSHVILRTDGREVPEQTIQETAILAALYSSEGEEEYVLVDYTEKKNVKKAKKAAPGMVYYEDYKTIQVNLKDAQPLKGE